MLVVEADAGFASSLLDGLTRAALAARIVERGGDALVAMVDTPPALLIVDVWLEDISGLALCRAIRSTHDIPLLVVNARGQPVPANEPWTAGADGYVDDPGRLAEIVARARALIRRSGPRSPRGPVSAVEAGTICVDPDARTVRVGAQTVPVAAKEFLVLEALVRADGRIVAQRVLLEEIWGTADVSGTGTLSSHIAKLRRKLELAGSDLTIASVRGVGYRLAAVAPPATEGRRRHPRSGGPC